MKNILGYCLECWPLIVFFPITIPLFITIGCMYLLFRLHGVLIWKCYNGICSYCHKERNRDWHSDIKHMHCPSRTISEFLSGD